MGPVEPHSSGEGKAPQSVPAAPRHELHYDGRGKRLFRILILNTLLSVLTLTLYRFWAKTRVRRFLWSSVRFLGDRFEYFGRPIELFYGFLIVIGVFVLFVLLYDTTLSFFATKDPTAWLLAQAAYPLLIYWLIQVAIYRARRYRLTRTLWRGIRAGQTGSAVVYALLAFISLIAVVVTAGLLLPLRNALLYRYRMNHTWFGDGGFRFEGSGGRLMGWWLLALIFLIPTLGLSYLWYKAAEMRYFARRTVYGRLEFRSTLSGGSLFRVYLPYIPGLILGAVLFAIIVRAGPGFELDVLTLRLTLYYAAFIIVFLTIIGIVRQIVIHRLVRTFCRRLAISGDQDFAAVRQSARVPPRFGEGLADALDAGGL